MMQKRRVIKVLKGKVCSSSKSDILSDCAYINAVWWRCIVYWVSCRFMPYIIDKSNNVMLMSDYKNSHK